MKHSQAQIETQRVSREQYSTSSTKKSSKRPEFGSFAAKEGTKNFSSNNWGIEDEEIDKDFSDNFTTQDYSKQKNKPTTQGKVGPEKGNKFKPKQNEMIEENNDDFWGGFGGKESKKPETAQSQEGFGFNNIVNSVFSAFDMGTAQEEQQLEAQQPGWGDELDEINMSDPDEGQQFEQ